MPSSVQYPFALDENNNLIFIGDIDVEHRHDHTYRCPNCGHAMAPRLGEHNAKHFAHSDNQKCGLETYIHKVAKRILVDRYNDRSRPFIIKFWTHLICKKKEGCKYFDTHFCEDSEQKEYDLHSVYDLPAEEEIRLKYISGETFQPDVILRSSSSKHAPIYLEVYHKHRVSPKKLESGQHIIEIRVRDWSELLDLDTFDIKQSERVSFYNFKDRIISPEILRKKAEELAKEFELTEPDFALPICLRSREGKRPYLDYHRLILYPSGKTFDSGIYQEEMNNHKPTALADITYRADIPKSVNLATLLIERIPKASRSCMLCCHCASDFDETNRWCSLVKNGSIRKGTFKENKGSYCTYFESESNAPSETNIVEGTDYTIWINPNLLP